MAMRFVFGLLLTLFITACVQISDAQPAAIDGKWNVTASFANGSSAAEMTLAQTGNAVEGSSGPLDENRYFPLTLKGALANGVAQLDVARGVRPVGKLSLGVKGGVLSGQGVLYGVPVTIAGARPSTATRAPVVHDFNPTTFVLQYSARHAPALRINPGDTLVVKLNKVRLNRDTASWRLPGWMAERCFRGRCKHGRRDGTGRGCWIASAAWRGRRRRRTSLPVLSCRSTR